MSVVLKCDDSFFLTSSNKPQSSQVLYLQVSLSVTSPKDGCIEGYWLVHKTYAYFEGGSLPVSDVKKYA